MYSDYVNYIYLHHVNIPNFYHVCRAVNAGKSLRNEDQACLRRAMLERPESRERNMRGVRQDLKKTASSPERINPATCLPYIYFALFDGHAGTGAAVAAANQLHHILHVSTFRITL